MTVCVIIPTLGERQSIEGTLASCIDADQVIAVKDELGDGCYGHPVRNRILDHPDLIRTTHVVSIDDDDVFTPGAMKLINATVAKTDGRRWFAFLMVGGVNSHFAGHVVGRRHVVAKGDIGTPMIVFPRDVKARYGVSALEGLAGSTDDFGPGYFGDFELATRLQAELGDPVWVDDIIAEVRP